MVCILIWVVGVARALGTCNEGHICTGAPSDFAGANLLFLLNNLWQPPVHLHQCVDQ